MMLGGILGGLGVAFGAFGAHALRERLGADALHIWEIGARYQMYHALAILACAFFSTRLDLISLRVAGWSFFVGTVLFSGSLFVLAFTGIRWLGMITPIGGAALICGWAALVWTAMAPTIKERHAPPAPDQAKSEAASSP